jgi:hypothetical protein
VARRRRNAARRGAHHEVKAKTSGSGRYQTGWLAPDAEPLHISASKSLAIRKLRGGIPPNAFPKGTYWPVYFQEGGVRLVHSSWLKGGVPKGMGSKKNPQLSKGARKLLEDIHIKGGVLIGPTAGSGRQKRHAVPLIKGGLATLSPDATLSDHYLLRPTAKGDARMSRRRNRSNRMAEPSTRWGDPTSIQTLLFYGGKDGKSGWHPSAAQDWALEHGFKAHKIDQPAEYLRIRQAPPTAFDKSTLRTITLTEKHGAPIKAVTGVRLPVDKEQRARAAQAKAMNRNPRRKRSAKREHLEQVWERHGAIRMDAPDPDEYGPMRGMEGPFRFRSGQTLYYDPKAGRYYDRKTDMYLGRDEDPTRNPDPDPYTVKHIYDGLEHTLRRAQEVDYHDSGAPRKRWAATLQSALDDWNRAGFNPSHRLVEAAEATIRSLRTRTMGTRYSYGRRQGNRRRR